MSTMPSGGFADYDLENQQLERRRKMAEMLSMQGGALPAGQMVGNVYVPTHWAQHAAQALNGYTADRQLDRIDQRQMDNTRRKSEEMAGEGRKFAELLKGTPGTTSTHTADDQMAYGGSPADSTTTQVQTPGVPGDRNAAMAFALGAKNPMLQQAGMQAMTQENKPFVVGRSLVDAQGRTLAVDNTWQAEQQAGREQKKAELEAKLADAATSRAEKAETQRQLAQMNIDARREAAAQANALRRDIAGARSAEMGKAPSGYRFKPNGDLEKIPGGPADEKTLAREAGGETVNGVVASLRDQYSLLDDKGGITNPKKGVVANALAGAQSSGAGQAVGKMLGTENQSARNTIAQQRPILLQAIMKATGMSAKQMDSNAELKLYLATATDPTLDVAANRRALDMIEKLYGSPNAPGVVQANQGAGASGSWGEPPAGAVRRKQ